MSGHLDKAWHGKGNVGQGSQGGQGDCGGWKQFVKIKAHSMYPTPGNQGWSVQMQESRAQCPIQKVKKEHHFLHPMRG